MKKKTKIIIICLFILLGITLIIYQLFFSRTVVDTTVKSYPIEETVKVYNFGEDYGVEFKNFKKEDNKTGYLYKTFAEQDENFLFLDVELKSKVQFKGNKSKEYIQDTEIPFDFGPGFEKIIDCSVERFTIKRLNLRTGEVSFVTDLKDTVEKALANYPNASIENIVLGYQSDNELTIEIKLWDKERAVNKDRDTTNESKVVLIFHSNAEEDFGNSSLSVYKEGFPLGQQKKSFLKGTQLENDNVLYSRNGVSMLWRSTTLSNEAFGDDANYYFFIVKSIENPTYKYYIDILAREGVKNIKKTEYEDVTQKFYSGSSVRIYFDSVESVGDIIEIFQETPVDYRKVRFSLWEEGEKEEVNKKMDDGQIVIETYAELEEFSRNFFVESEKFAERW